MTDPRIELVTKPRLEEMLPARLSDAAMKAAFGPDVVNVNDVGYDVILVAGQSNAEGQGQSFDPYLDFADPRIQQYANISSAAYYGQVVQAIDPLFHRHLNSGNIGHAMTFAKLYAATIPANRKVLIVPTAAAGTGFTSSSNPSPPAGYQYVALAGSGTWDQNATDGGANLYTAAVAHCNAAIASGTNNRIVAVLWLQGEADATYLTGAQYSAKLDALIAGFRSSITGAANVPFLIGQMQPDGIALSGSKQNINAAHIDTPRRNTRCAFYYGTAGLQNGDNLHYSAAGQRLLGSASYAALAIARANVLGVAPLSPGALSFVQSGTMVTVNWRRPVGRATDYTAQYSINGGTSWTTISRGVNNIDRTATITGLTLGAAVQVRVFTTNEQGSSGYSTGSFTLATLPGQVTGVTAGTPTSVAVPLSWSAVAGATSYLVEYGAHNSGTWATYGIVTGASIASGLTTLAASTSYDFRFIAQNAAGSGTPSAVLNVTTAASSPLLADVGVTSYRALSLRKLNPSYPGACVKVRRSSDSTTQDIGFTAGGDLDSTALLAFAGAGSAYIATWYDQSGNGRDLTQATAASQPRVVNAGVLDTTPNGKAAPVFASSSLTGSSVGLYAAGSSTTCAVARATTLGSTNGLVGEGSSAGSSAKTLLYTNAAGALRSEFDDDSNVQFGLGSAGTPFAASAMTQVSQTDSGAQMTIFANGAQLGSVAYSRAGKSMSLTTAVIGAVYNSGVANSPWTGQIAEVVQWTSVLNSAQRTAAEANQKTYYGTP